VSIHICTPSHSSGCDGRHDGRRFFPVTASENPIPNSLQAMRKSQFDERSPSSSRKSGKRYFSDKAVPFWGQLFGAFRQSAANRNRSRLGNIKGNTSRLHELHQAHGKTRTHTAFPTHGRFYRKSATRDRAPPYQGANSSQKVQSKHLQTCRQNEIRNSHSLDIVAQGRL